MTKNPHIGDFRFWYPGLEDHGRNGSPSCAETIARNCHNRWLLLPSKDDETYHNLSEMATRWYWAFIEAEESQWPTDMGIANSQTYAPHIGTEQVRSCPQLSWRYRINCLIRRLKVLQLATDLKLLCSLTEISSELNDQCNTDQQIRCILSCFSTQVLEMQGRPDVLFALFLLCFL